MQTIRWGIIGCGDVTEVKSGPAFQKVGDSELVAVMRRDAGKAADYARRHNVPRWYDNADRLIADPEVDAVYVATPPGTHELYAMKTLAARKPCYVEKPMARNAAEARRMVEGFKAAGVPLFVAYYRRALPRFLKVRDILAAGALGPLKRSLYFYEDSQMSKRLDPPPWRLVPEQSGAGPFLDLASHALDLIDFVFGPFAVKSAAAGNSEHQYDVEDWVTISGSHQNPAQSLIASWRFAHPQRGDEFWIQGEKKAMLSFSCFGNEPLWLRHPDGREEWFDLPNPPHVQQPLIQTIVDDLLGHCPSSGESALRTQNVMDAALTTYYGGREDNFWTRPWPGAPSQATPR